jgi:hypothetical protein
MDLRSRGSIEPRALGDHHCIILDRQGNRVDLLRLRSRIPRADWLLDSFHGLEGLESMNEKQIENPSRLTIRISKEEHEKLWKIKIFGGPNIQKLAKDGIHKEIENYDRSRKK